MTTMRFLEAKASKGLQPGLYRKKKHLTAAYLYICVENSSTGCTNQGLSNKKIERP